MTHFPPSFDDASHEKAIEALCLQSLKEVNPRVEQFVKATFVVIAANQFTADFDVFNEHRHSTFFQKIASLVFEKNNIILSAIEWEHDNSDYDFLQLVKKNNPRDFEIVLCNNAPSYIALNKGEHKKIDL